MSSSVSKKKKNIILKRTNKYILISFNELLNMERLVSVVILLILPNVLYADRPVISHISNHVYATVGDDVQFNCTVEHIGRMSVSWSSQSVVLSIRNMLSLSDPRYSITETRDDAADNATYTLKIANIKEEDHGLYQCQVIVSASDKVSKELKLTLKVPPTILAEYTPKSKVVTEGEKLSVNCYAEGMPRPRIQWSRADNAIMPAGGKTLAGPLLHIEKVHRLDRGTYVCVANNGAGQPAQYMVQVEVEFRPQIFVLRPKVAQVPSHVAELECCVQAYPAPAVFWYRNGAKIQSTASYEITNTASPHETTTSVLRIASVSEEDYGDYYCNATNKLGNADARLNLFQPVIPVPSSV